MVWALCLPLLFVLSLVFSGHVACNPVISHSCEAMIGNRKQGNPYLDTEKAEVCPKHGDSFSIHHPPLLVPAPSPSPPANGTHLHSLAQVHAGQHLQEAQKGF